MARRHAHIQNAFSKGELDPLLYDRIDLKHYYNALKEALNVEMLPQGGFRRRAGQGSISRLRRRLEPILLTAGMLAAPNGGTASNLIDGTSSALTTGAPAGTDYVVATVDLGAAKAVCFVDVIGFSAAGDTDTVTATLNADGTGMGGLTHRQRIAAAQISTSGNQVRLTLEPPSTGNDTIIRDCFIGEAAATGANFAKAPTRVTFGGANSVTLVAGGSAVVSDVVGYSLDEAKDLLITMNFGSPSDVRRDTSATGWTLYHKASVQEAAELEVTGYTTATTDANVVSKIETAFFAKPDCLTVEYESTPAVWTPFSPGASGNPLAYRDIGPSARSRRFGLAPGSTVTARNWRIVARSASGAASVSVQELRLWAEKAVRGPVGFLPFATTLADFYTLVLSGGNVDVLRTDQWSAAARMPLPHDLVALAGWLQSEDTGLLMHEDYAPGRLTRQAGDNEWNTDFPQFANVPTLTPQTAFTEARFAQQRVAITGLAAGNVIVFGVKDHLTGSLTYSGALTAGDIETAIEAAPNVDAAGVTVSSVSAAGNALSFDVAFVGVNANRHWPRLVSYIIGNAAAIATVTVLQEGVPAATPAFGDTVGWPRCGLLWQARLHIGGCKTHPSTWLASRNGSLFDFLTGDLPTDALALRLDTDQVETIRAIVAGRHLSLMTDTGEWYVENRTLDATAATNLVRPTGNGIAAGVPPAFAEGALLFIPAPGEADEGSEGGVLRAFLFSDAEGTYNAEPLSLLGSHLLTDVKGLVWRRPRDTKEGGLVIMPNGDGSMAVMTYLRSQEIVSLAKHATDGLYKAATVNVARTAHYAVERTIGGVTDNWLERRNPARLLDASVTRSLASTNAVTGLAHLEGKTNVWAIAAGNPHGPLTVTGGQMTLPLPATFSGDVEVGLFFEVKARTLPLRPQLPEDQKFKPPGRCFRLIVSVVATGGFAISANGQPRRTIACRDPAQPLTDVSMMDALFTGDVVIEDLEGWTNDVEVEISQPTPAPLTVRSIRMEVVY